MDSFSSVAIIEDSIPTNEESGGGGSTVYCVIAWSAPVKYLHVCRKFRFLVRNEPSWRTNLQTIMITTIAPTSIASIHTTIILTIASTTSSFIASLTPPFVNHHNHHSSLTFVQLWQRGAQYIIIYFVLRCILLEVCILRECTFST